MPIPREINEFSFQGILQPTTAATEFSCRVFVCVTCFLSRVKQRPPTRVWEVVRTVAAPPSIVVKCLWEVFVWGSCRARVCAGVGGVFSVGVSWGLGFGLGLSSG